MTPEEAKLISETVYTENIVRFRDYVVAWLIDCFGIKIAQDKNERNHRFMEEALELVQSLGCTKEDVLTLVDYVYDRPLGEPMQEVGGVMVALSALCYPNAIDLELAANTELRRIYAKIDKIRQKQATKPMASPLPEYLKPST